MRPLHSPLFRAFLLLLIILVVGVIGFYLIVPSYSFFDALYMTVITISNVGYGEVGELSNQRRVFAICLTLVGFVLVALAVRFIVESLLSNWTADFWKIKKTGCNVIGYRDEKGEQYINPGANRSLSAAGS